MRRWQIISCHFSTHELAASDQYDAFREWASSIAFDLDKANARPDDGFSASSTAFYVGDVIVESSDTTPQRYNRTTRRIRGDQLDHLLFSSYRSGGWECQSRNHDQRGLAGQVGVIDLAQPLAKVQPCREFSSIFVPRKLLEDRLPNLASLHGRALNGPFADMLFEYINCLSRCLPTLVGESGEHLSRAICDMLVVCLDAGRENAEAADVQLKALLMRRAKRYIIQEVRSPDLSIDAIANHLRSLEAHAVPDFRTDWWCRQVHSFCSSRWRS